MKTLAILSILIYGAMCMALYQAFEMLYSAGGIQAIIGG